MEYQIDAGTTGGATLDRPTLYYPRPAETNPTGKLASDNLAFNATRPVNFLSHNTNVLGNDTNRIAGTAYKGRGAWKLKEVYAKGAGGTKRKPLVADTDVYMSFEVTEPLLMSPLGLGSHYGKQGF
jgi:hypothetical protein